MYKVIQQPLLTMYPSHPVTSSMNGIGIGSFDNSNTIDPNSLNTPVPLPAPSYDLGPRGQKRSRSPESYDTSVTGQPDEGPAGKKRGRPRKETGSSIDSPIPPSPHSATRPPGSSHGMQALNKPATPAKAPQKTVLKALPTVRDHTTDQLNAEGDEFIPREFDVEGEKKVSQDGRPLGGREYRVRTFLVPNRGDKLFMLATECARILSYRDSYLLFNKNRSLYKIIANQTEKDDLIQQEILPYSYRSRQIAIVTARSMFRQFGSRLIQGGRRVRDDYWEAKAKKQGFTEDDPAGEKRPGGSRQAREAQEAANAANLAHQDVVYNNGPQPLPLDVNGAPHFMHGLGGPMAHGMAPTLPMIRPTDDMSLRNDYAGISRGPRQDITGIPYQDRITPSTNAEMLSQTGHAADFNKAVNAQAKVRKAQLDEFYKQPRDIANPGVLQPGPESPSVSNATLPTGPPTTAGMLQSGQPGIVGQSQMYQQHPQAQTQQPPALPPPTQHHAASQSPVRTMQPQLQHQGMGYGGSQPPYNYPPQSQMWGQPPPHPHQSPAATQHGLPQYSSQAPHGSPHPSQSPHQHPQAQPQLQHPPMGYPQPQIGQYGAQSSMYRPPQTGSPHGYMQGSTPGTGPGMQSWAAPSAHPNHGQWSSNY